MLPIKTILFPTDFSEPAKNAFHLACSLARNYSARVIVLHVYPPPIGHEEVEARRDPQRYEKMFWDALHELQPTDPSVKVEHQLAEGGAAEEILRIAAEDSCDMIIMSTHGRSGLARTLMGSVAESVLRKASCPVLTIRSLPGEGQTVPGGGPAR